MNKYLKNLMITFKQFLEEAKKKEVAKIQAKAIDPKKKLSSREVMAVLNSQGGIGGNAVKKAHGIE
jgi:deoxyadenosine/deoxycytidine kinase